jgi:hypothetical protein
VSNAVGADFTVINTSNAGAGSLRQAIADANASPGLDRIVFDIPGAGLQVIRTTTALPTNTGPVEIDGYTQPGSTPNTLPDADNGARLVELNGMNATFDGLVLSGGNSVVRGLSIRRFNVGVRVESYTNLIVGNLVGSELPGVTNGNVVGVIVSSGCCSILGGTNAADRNIIAGNSGNSIRIGGEFSANPARDNRVLGNFVGVLSSGNAASANLGSSGISLRASVNAVIGGLEPGARNIISAGVGGVTVYGPATNTYVFGNHIGVGADGVTPLLLGYSGVYATDLNSDETTYPQSIRIEGNRIANLRNGVALSEPAFDPSPAFAPRGVTISSNAIYANSSGGIGLGSLGYAMTNDLLDLDTGANERQNFPEVTSAEIVDGITTIAGVLHSAPTASYRIEFFGNSRPHPSGRGEGELYLGFTNVTTDFNGTASFQITFPESLALHSHFTATATDAEGNTSMFSRSLQGRSPTVPIFHLIPAPITVLPYTNATFQGEASGAPPLTFQWRRDGIDLPEATNTTFSLSNIVWDDRGIYTLVASNSFGAVESPPAALTVVAQPTVIVPPTNVFVFPGANATFSVQAGGMLPIHHQWRRDGLDLPDETNSTLIFPSVDWPQRGQYSVELSNAFGVVESLPATLFVKIRPFFVNHPISQNVVTGGTVVLSVGVTNTAGVPIAYLWRSNSVTIARVVSLRRQSFLSISNIRANVNYSVIASNDFGPPGVLSSRANLTVLTDTDGDGLPDEFEDAFELDANDPGDAALDSDGDGISNGDEYASGTNPQDPADQLRVIQIDEDGEIVRIEFNARSNQTYSVQFRNALGDPGWQLLSSVPARESNHVAEVMDPAAHPRRFYRLATPFQP